MSAGISGRDVALMRQLIEWRASVGYEFKLSHGAWVQRSGLGPARRAITWDKRCGEVGFTEDYRRKLMRWVAVRSVTQGVDVLVAFGFLPARFSSAYAAGWEVGREDIEHPGPAGEAFRAIVPAVLL